MNLPSSNIPLDEQISYLFDVAKDKLDKIIRKIKDCKNKTWNKLTFKIGYKKEVENSPLVLSLKESSYTYQIIQDFQKDVEFYNSLGPE